MAQESGDNTPRAVWFLAGIAVGATVALLYAPASGQVTRRRIGRAASKGKDALAETGQDMIDRGRELYERGRKMADEAAEMFDRGRKLVEG